MNPSTRLFRSRHGLLLGVCRGLAERFGVSVFWTRVATLALLWFSGWWPLTGLYILMALLMPSEPAWAEPGVCAPREFLPFHPADLRGRCCRLEARVTRVEDRLLWERDWDERLQRKS